MVEPEAASETNATKRIETPFVFSQPHLVTTIRLTGGGAISLSFTPDSTRLVVGSGDDTDEDAVIGVYSTVDWQLERQIAFDESLSFICVSPDNRLIGVCGFSGIAKIFNADTGDEVANVSMKGPLTRSIGFSADSRHVAVSGTNSVTIWDVATEDKIKDWIVSPQGIVNAVAFRPSTNQIATAGEHVAVRLWDAATTELAFDAYSGRGTRLAFSADGGLIAALAFPQRQLGNGMAIGSGVSRVLIIDANTGNVLSDFRDHGANCVAFTPSGRLLAVGGVGRRAAFYHVDSAKEVGRMATEIEDMNTLSFSPDGKYLAIGSEHTDTVEIWDVSALTSK